MVRVIVTLNIRLDKDEEFNQLAYMHREQTRCEPGCIQFDIGRVAHRYILLELFQDQAALHAHRQTPHYRRWREVIHEMEAAPRTHEEYDDGAGLVLKSIELESWLRTRWGNLVVTNGVFSILTSSHAKFLTECRAQGDLLLVLMNSDRSCSALGRTPLLTQDERLDVIAAIRPVSAVTLFDESEPVEVLKRVAAIRPFVLAKGGDYKGRMVVGAEYASKVYLTDDYGPHATDVISRLRG